MEGKKPCLITKEIRMSFLCLPSFSMEKVVFLYENGGKMVVYPFTLNHMKQIIRKKKKKKKHKRIQDF